MAKGKPLKQIEIKEDAYKLTHEIEDNKNEIMTIDNNISVNFIGKFENLQNDFNNLLSKLGSENIQLPHIHKSDRSRYRTYYSEESKALVEEFYKKDIQEFGYEF